MLEINGKKILGIRGETLYESLLRAGIFLAASCGRSGLCGECRVEIRGGENLLGPRSGRELNLAPGQRLSCQAVILADQGIIRLSSAAATRQRIEESGTGAFGLPAGFDPAVEVSGGKVLMDGQAIDEYRGGVYGAALDIGTSTVVLRVVDLSTGETAAAESFINPQFFAGSDVISRISHAGEKGAGELQKALVEKINQVLKVMSIPDGLIYEMVVAGNPAMRDIFLGFDVGGLGQDPFHSFMEAELRLGKRDSTAVYVSPSEIGLSICPGGRIYGLPFPGCHVGGDISAGMLASGIAWKRGNSLFLDLGTNSEIVVKGEKGIFAASCPAGPAFEGGRINCGMPALSGAVEAVRILPGCKIKLEVIGGTAPAGFCGSGLISLLGELFRSGIINERGRIRDSSGWNFEEKPIPGNPDTGPAQGHPGCGTPIRSFSIRNADSRPTALVFSGREGLFLDEEDISRLLQAKAAITAGVRIALRNCGLEVGEIERFYLAGAFGRYLDLGAALEIGILPELAMEKFRRLGNSSIEGATMALLSSGSRKNLEKIVRGMTHLELESEADFFELYTDGCLLGKMN